LKLHQSKIRGMKIEKDFKEIHIIDPLTSNETKKDVFADIIKRHGYDKTELLVVGDDLHSELEAGQELGIDVVLYDKYNVHNNNTSLNRISDFRELKSFLF
jgi:putative hydrolase of the HAD superfamily